MPRNAALRTKYPPNTIRRTRKQLGIGRNTLAKLLSIRPITLWRWETRQTMPKWDNLERLAHALRTTPATLMPAMSHGMTPCDDGTGDHP